MKNLKKNFLFILTFAIIMSLTGCGKETETESGAETPVEETVSYGSVEEGAEAPDFTADLYGGETFTLSDYKGKVVVLNLWATWCGPCVREMPAFEKLQENYGEQVAVIAVNCMEEKETVDAFMEETGYTFPVAYDVEGDICMKYPTDGIPNTYIIDGDGIVKKVYLGAADAETQYQEYESAVKAILQEE